MSILTNSCTILTIISILFVNYCKIETVYLKALSFKIPKLEEESLKLQEDKLNYFYDLFHFHPEYQITLILKGKGKFTIGESTGRFEKNDMFIIGSNVPHVFRSSGEYYENSKLLSHSLSIFFKEDSFGNGFFKLPELEHIGDMFPGFNRGIKISSDITYNKYFLNVFEHEGLSRIQRFLDLLNAISLSNEIEYLSGKEELIKSSEQSDKRLNDVFNFVLNNYKNEITLSGISEIANLSEPAFCRYFKKRTRKTFFDFLNELRISEACKLLLNKDLSISEAAFEVGFNNISNFNRKFKSIIGLTPTEYSKRKK